jgi:hypothetical protein
MRLTIGGPPRPEGFMTYIMRIRGATIAIPDFSCISKRTVELTAILMTKALKSGSVVIVDSTGLKVYGKDEWHQEKHAVSPTRTWRKLHLAIDEHHHVLACELTTPEVGDTTATADLLSQITTPFDTFVWDGDRPATQDSGCVFNGRHVARPAYQ